MPKIDVLDASGQKTDTADLDDAVFGIEPNGPVLHQVVTAQLAARRAGTQSTKTRAEVAGGGAKPWKQKGTGRARQGSIRSPQWSGGGVALGPKPRSYSQRTPKKMVRLALRSALSDRAADGKVKVVDLGFDAPGTKQAARALADIGVEGKVLLVLAAEDVATWKSFRNLTDVHIIVPGELNAYDVLVSDWVVFTPSTIPADTSVSRGPAPTPAGHRGGAPGERATVPVTAPDTDAVVEAANDEDSEDES
jgi:large subunit ribosomal protein L4